MIIKINNELSILVKIENEISMERFFGLYEFLKPFRKSISDVNDIITC
jgi:hypothetical protein